MNLVLMSALDSCVDSLLTGLLELYLLESEASVWQVLLAVSEQPLLEVSVPTLLKTLDQKSMKIPDLLDCMSVSFL